MKAEKIDYKILPKDKTTVQLAKLVCKSLIDMKAVNLKLINVKGISSVTDVMIVASGTSSRHVKSLSDDIIEQAKANATPPLGVEGQDSCEWVLVDLGDVLVHIMQEKTREFYELEKLWEINSENHTIEPASS